jgi:hypothetical protein
MSVELVRGIVLDVQAFSSSQVAMFHHLLAPILPGSPAQSKLRSLDIMPYTVAHPFYTPEQWL